jgi:membrane protease subunit HflC
MKTKILAIVVVLIAFIGLTSMFQVNEMEKVVVLRMGKPVGKPIEKSGLMFKMPIIDEVVKFDKRILEYDSEPKDIITLDKKNVVIDNYAKWKIDDPLLLLQTVNSVIGAQSRIDDIVYSELRQVIGQYTFLEIISVKRIEIMEKVTVSSAVKLRDLGIELLDVRMKRAELPEQNKTNIYQRMEAERSQQAKKYRAEGQEKALEVRSNAERERTGILAEAYKTSKILEGEGDAEALKIYAEAYNKDKEFYKFTRTLEAYEKLLSTEAENKVILSTDSELWKVLSGE